MAENKLLLSRAKSALLSRDYDFAARLYKQMLGESPEDESLLLELGSVYSKAGKDSQALSVYQKLVQINPDNIEALMAMSAIYRRTRNYDESVKMLEHARSIDGKNMQIVYNLGFTYKSMGKYDEAIACFEDVIDQNPSDVLAYNHIGSIYAEQGDHETAISSYLRALKVDSNHPIIQLNLAKSYEATGEIEKALSAYESSLRAKPGWLEAVGAYSDLLLKLDRVHEAYAVLRNAVAINPKDARTHTQLGHVYYRQSIFEDAKKEYKTALECDSKYDPALVGLADTQETLHEHAEASRTIRRAEEIKPGDTIITQKAAHIMLSANEYSDAFERISRLRDQTPEDVQALSLLGQYYICNGEWDKVEECYQKIAEYDPTFSDHYRDGAKRFNQRGDRENEERYLRKAIERNPNDSNAMMSLGLLLENARRGKEAFAVYQQANKADSLNAASKDAVARLQTAFGPIDITEYVPPMTEDAAEKSTATHGMTEPDAAAADSLVQSDSAFSSRADEPAAYTPAFTSTASTRTVVKTIFDDLFDKEWVDVSSSTVDSVIVPADQTPGAASLPEETNTASHADDLAGSVFDAASLGQLAENQDEVEAAEFATNAMTHGSAFAAVTKAHEKLEELKENVQQAEEAAEKAEYAAQQAWQAAQAAADSAQAADVASTFATGNTPDTAAEPAPIDATDTTSGSESNVVYQVQPAAPAHAASEPALEPLEEAEEELEPLEEAEPELAPAEDVPPTLGPTDEADASERADGAESAECEPTDAAPTDATSTDAKTSTATVAVADSLRLFKRLRTLCEYLPQAHYERFMSSHKRLLLDYVIARLSGEPGLLAQATEQRTPDAACLPPEEQDEDGIALVTHVVDDMLTLIQAVPDHHLRAAMETETKDLIEKLIKQ